MITVYRLDQIFNPWGGCVLTAASLAVVTQVPVELRLLALVLFDGAPQLLIDLGEEFLLPDLIIQVPLQLDHVLPHQLQHLLT